MTTEYHVVRPRTIVEEIVITEMLFKNIEAGEAIGEYEVLYQDGVLIKKANATNSTKMDAIGILNKTVALGVLGDVIIRGRVTTPGPWTSGAALFVSTTDGEMTHTPPAASGNVAQVLGKALTATLIEINPQPGYLIAHE